MNKPQWFQSVCTVRFQLLKKIIFSYKPARHKRRQTLPDLLWLWFFEMSTLNTCICWRLNMREIFSDVKHQSIYQWTVVFLHKSLSCQLLINQRGKYAHKSVVTCMKNTSDCDLQMKLDEGFYERASRTLPNHSIIEINLVFF